MNINNPSQDVDYEVFLVDSGEGAIRLLLDPYKDVEYSYSEISTAEKENPDGSLDMSFNLVFYNGPETLVDDPEFKKLVGNILLDILIKACKDVINSPEEYKNAST